ncbi:MAG: hypothetical protein AB1540_05955 [Bdellovibrionota bacterium]
MAQNLVFSSSLIVLLLLPGCNPADNAVKFFNENIGGKIGFKLEATEKNSPAPSPEPSPTLSLEHRRVNGEFIKELFKVVVLRDLKSEEEFIKYMNVLDQGGHYEGIYNGIVYSSEYREKERGVASVPALKAYSEILAQIILDQKYDPLKIPKTENPAVPLPTADSVKAPEPSDAERMALVAELEKDGIARSLFTLKRRLGEEALKTIDLKKEYREKLATWYGRFTVYLNKRGVDFRLPERNKMDEYFHYKWALDAEEDRLKWECLNRLHTILNSVSQ